METLENDEAFHRACRVVTPLTQIGQRTDALVDCRHISSKQRFISVHVVHKNSLVL